MKDWFAYFFGQGNEVEFQNFTLAHFLPILLAASVIFVIYKKRNALAASKCDTGVRYVLAFMMICCEMSYFWRMVGNAGVLNPNAVDHLPISVCGWAIIFGSFMLVGKSQSLFDICYFWVLSGTIFALITPSVIDYTGPTRYRYYQFWAEHLLGYVAVFYMIFVHKFRPTIRSFIKAYGLMAVLAAVAYTTNAIIGPGANYLFLSKSESDSSISSLLPNNMVLRILIMAVAVSVLFAMAYLPWFIMDRKAKKREKVSV